MLTLHSWSSTLHTRFYAYNQETHTSSVKLGLFQVMIRYTAAIPAILLRALDCRITNVRTAALRLVTPEKSAVKNQLKVKGTGEPQKEGTSGDSCCSWAICCIFNLFFLEFHYRYNIPGQNYLNCSERRACVPLCFLNENKNSSPCKSISCMIPSL